MSSIPSISQINTKHSEAPPSPSSVWNRRTVCIATGAALLTITCLALAVFTKGAALALIVPVIRGSYHMIQNPDLSLRDLFLHAFFFSPLPQTPHRYDVVEVSEYREKTLKNSLLVPLNQISARIEKVDKDAIPLANTPYVRYLLNGGSFNEIAKLAVNLMADENDDHKPSILANLSHAQQARQEMCRRSFLVHRDEKRYNQEMEAMQNEFYNLRETLYAQAM